MGIMAVCVHGTTAEMCRCLCNSPNPAIVDCPPGCPGGEEVMIKGGENQGPTPTNPNGASR